MTLVPMTEEDCYALAKRIAAETKNYFVTRIKPKNPKTGRYEYRYLLLRMGQHGAANIIVCKRSTAKEILNRTKIVTNFTEATRHARIVV